MFCSRLSVFKDTAYPARFERLGVGAAARRPLERGGAPLLGPQLETAVVDHPLGARAREGGRTLWVVLERRRHLGRLAEEHVPRLLEQVAVAHSLPPPQRAHGAGVGAVAGAVRLALELRGQSDVEAARSLAYARARHREQRVCIES